MALVLVLSAFTAFDLSFAGWAHIGTPMVKKIPARRIMLLVAASVCIGATVGGCAVAILAPFVLSFGIVGGAIVGVIVSPVLVALLGRKPPLRALAIVIGPSLIAGVLGGLSLNPAVSLLAIVVFLGMAGVASAVLADDPSLIRLGTCRTCGYEVNDLSTCPECGTDQANAVPDGRTVNRRIRLAFALAVAAGGLGLLGFASYNRHRVRSTAELVDQLGDNDMQLQWEARHELAKRDSAALIAALSDPRVGVRRNAAWALVDIRDPAARPALTRLLNDPDRWTRDYANQALSHLPPQ